MSDFIELFDESDLIDLNIEPIKKKEVIKIVKNLKINEKKSHQRRNIDTVYVSPEESKQLINMMLIS